MSVQKASDIFGDITVYPAKDGKQRVEMYIRLQEKVEGMQIGIGIDGSASMRKMFGDTIPKFARRPEDNVMQTVVQRLCSYACEYSGDGSVSPIYWATGIGGKEIESLGKLDSEAIQARSFEDRANGELGLRCYPHLITFWLNVLMLLGWYYFL